MRKRAELILSNPETDNFASHVTEEGKKYLMFEKNKVKRKNTNECGKKGKKRRKEQ
jgi:hypothetical protein